jgi:two-component system chemotaxis family response regulator WspR
MLSDTSPNNTINVLLVDDQQMVAEAIKRMLADDADIEFHYTDQPMSAINMAIEVDATIILQDLVMPDIDGMTLVRYYRANKKTADIPIIVLSSKEDPVIKSDAFYSGANDYLVKLPDKIELLARIRSHAKHYLMKLERDAAFMALREMQKQLEDTNAELERLSSLDGLTGLANRRTFDETLSDEVKRSSRENSIFSLILADIDFFKAYNDNYGHLGGDECLKQVADILKQTASRPGDLAARYGGEEFALILPATDKNGAMTVCQNLRAAINKSCISHEHSSASEHVTISMGIATCDPAQGTSPENIIENADKALYSSKENGRDRFTHVDDIGE